jgi:predicted nucleotidyltransferase component of viral defense system
VITEGQIRLISRYYAGQGRRFAYLELAQEHLLAWMTAEGLFAGAPGDVVFKGGTAIRKFRLGKRGRFSTDLDFAVSQDAFAHYVLDALQQGGVEHAGVRFHARAIDRPAAKGVWYATVPGIADATMDTKIEFTRRRPLLPPVVPTRRPEISGVSPDLLGFDLPLVPIMRLEENLAEKLARFRRIVRSRDCYDLAETGREVRGALDLIRLIVCFKVYFDIVRDGRPSAVPFLAGPEYVGRKTVEIVDPDDLGLIVGGQVDYQEMLGAIGSIFGPMGSPSGPLEQRLAAVNKADLYWADGEYAQLAEQYRAAPPEGDRGLV